MSEPFQKPWSYEYDPTYNEWRIICEFAKEPGSRGVLFMSKLAQESECKSLVRAVNRDHLFDDVVKALDHALFVLQSTNHTGFRDGGVEKERAQRQGIDVLTKVRELEEAQ